MPRPNVSPPPGRRPDRSRHVLGTVLCVAACLVGVACDTGDGKTLKDPVGTVPPPSTTTPIDDPFDEPFGDLGGSDTFLDDPALIDPAPAAEEFTLFAPWLDGGPIDVRHTCDGDDVSPALSWTEPPPGTVELALIVTDESVANGPPFIHWAIAGIDPAGISLLEGSPPVGAPEAVNFFGNVGWGGPCPPPGDEAHRYRFALLALNQQVELADGTPATDFLDFVETVAFASAEVIGTYRR